jgi:cysteine desulfurase
LTESRPVANPLPRPYFSAVLYFDHNATCPMLPEARDAWLEAVERYPGNPSSLHRVGDRADRAMNLAREKLAAMLGCHPLDIVFTSGATESANLVMRHAAAAYSEFASIWVSSIEHPCVTQPWRFLFPKRGVPLRSDEHGVVRLDAVESALEKRRPALVAVMAANNETGVIQPWSGIGEVCREHGVDYFCDATQWLGRLPAKGLGSVDFVAGSAHKFGGPRGVGFLKVKGQGAFQGLFRGGMQEEGRRAGTENVPGILSMVKALEVRESALGQRAEEPRREWRDSFLRELMARLPGSQVLGGQVERLWNTATVLLPAKDCRQRFAVRLDKAGFAVSTGSACASGKEEPSPVLLSMGVAVEDTSRVLRFSAGWETTESDWKALLNGVLRVASESDSTPGME